MEKVIEIRRKNGVVLKGKLKVLNKEYINQIMELQEEVIRGLRNREWYSPTTKEEFLMQLTEVGKIVGCILENGMLIAIGAYAEWKYEEYNYGYDLGISGAQLLKVGQIEATLVNENFRGNGLQKKICTELENIAASNKNKVMAVTVHPDNVYSLRTFKALGYNVKLEKLKYNGLRRLILSKDV